MLTTTPEPPYVAVIFANRRPVGVEDGYGAAAARMMELVAQQPGFLGADSARDAEGLGITVSYWADEASALAWRRNLEHAEVMRQGRERFYEAYTLRVATVHRATTFHRD
ncbi:MAG TPA: antibiotic biosynthesis monooxygenase [Holophagaceae bacterium]|nr:antibiotic biosynthesis monooxygenase [Holophagaceae bacterium]